MRAYAQSGKYHTIVDVRDPKKECFFVSLILVFLFFSFKHTNSF